MNEIEHIIKAQLKKYNFQLSSSGVEAIRQQVILLYGQNPTINQIKAVVDETQISFLQLWR